ncbi:MAG: hypothetical protein ACRD2A_07410 [Vicinamibacterales bacterium]
MQRHEYLGEGGTFQNAPTITPGVGAKGAYAQLLAAAAFNYDGLLLQIRPSGVPQRVLVDLAVGAATFEQVIASDLYVIASTNGAVSSFFPLPIRVPAGSRLSVRGQSNVADAVVARYFAYAGGFRQSSPLGLVTTLGQDLTNTRGTVLTAGAANTYGAWVQLSASTPVEFRWILLAFGPSSVATAGVSYVDIGIGAAAAEKPILAEIEVAYAANVNNPSPQTVAFPVFVPPGARLSARTISDSTGTPTMEVILYGVR